MKNLKKELFGTELVVFVLYSLGESKFYDHNKLFGDWEFFSDKYYMVFEEALK